MFYEVECRVGQRPLCPAPSLNLYLVTNFSKFSRGAWICFLFSLSNPSSPLKYGCVLLEETRRDTEVALFTLKLIHRIVCLLEVEIKFSCF